ncbi:hypothetical protein PoB_004623000 [Plakobranchus ocellatus]|uniref:Uncharacterized protein n=1 Tax=Plakobranchus ocellatus TaxID=259542 RepID=A0AAV4BL03_9GAST|nr:hypothetical protein PoB_004623000 [Plakobranchus ocellatus]
MTTGIEKRWKAFRVVDLRASAVLHTDLAWFLALCGGWVCLRLETSQPRVVYGLQSITDDLKLSGAPSGQGAGCGARTRDGRISADLRADSLSTEPQEWDGVGLSFSFTHSEIKQFMLG